MSVKSMRMVITSHATAPRVTARVGEAPISLEPAAQNEVASRSLRTRFIGLGSGGPIFLQPALKSKVLTGVATAPFFCNATRFGCGGRLELLRRGNWAAIE